MIGFATGYLMIVFQVKYSTMLPILEMLLGLLANSNSFGPATTKLQQDLVNDGIDPATVHDVFKDEL